MDHPQRLAHERAQTLGGGRPGGSLEEAGIVGRPLKTTIGSYIYFKRQIAHFDVCRVDVYLLAFSEQRKSWHEKGQREARWFGLDEAPTLVEEPGLVKLLLALRLVGIDAMKL